MPRYLIGETPAPGASQGPLYCHAIDEARTTELRAAETAEESLWCRSITVCGRVFGTTPLAEAQGDPCPDCDAT